MRKGVEDDLCYLRSAAMICAPAFTLPSLLLPDADTNDEAPTDKPSNVGPSVQSPQESSAR